MLKIKLSVLMGLVSLSVFLGVAHTVSANETAEATPIEMSTEVTEIAEAAAFPVACTAVTTCFTPYRPPYTISCQTFGQACTWWVVPNHSVQCTGMDAWGRWVNFYYRCWY